MKLFRFRHNSLQSGVVHSNGFANAADHGNPSFGSTSAESFAQRRAIDRNRQHINRFQDARIHQDYRAPKSSQEPEVEGNHVTQPAPPERPARSPIPRTTGGFREPTSRGFNPFK